MQWSALVLRTSHRASAVRDERGWRAGGAGGASEIRVICDWRKMKFLPKKLELFCGAKCMVDEMYMPGFGKALVHVGCGGSRITSLIH